MIKFLVVAAHLLLAAAGWSQDVAVGKVRLLRDLPYRDKETKSCRLDLAIANEAVHKLRPAIVVIHGGGWIEGDKSSFSTPEHPNPASILNFAKLGFVGVTINYRLSGEAPFPAALDDCRCATRWLRAHAKEYQIDPARIGAYGNSAGGHLALLLAMLTDEPGPHEPHAEQSSAVQAVVSDSGPLDLLEQQRKNQLTTVIEKFMGGPPAGAREAIYKRASPVNHIAAPSIPMLLIYGEIDTQVDVRITDKFVAALSQAGCKDVSYIRLANVDHCPHSLIRIPYLRQVVDGFFARTLGLANPKP